MDKEKDYRQCTKCLLDTTSRTISFDSNGVCNYCHSFELQMQKFINIDPLVRRGKLLQMVDYVKKVGKNNKYDCIIGLSGGVDSSYLALLAVKLGLRPLAVHFDNGWNSELAVKNIEQIVSKLGLDLDTYVINWEEFKAIQLAYLRASVVDIEVPTDQLIVAALYKIAKEKRIKYILSGYNIVTEYGMPSDWVFKNKLDQTNLINIYKRFGSGKKLLALPKFNYYRRFFYMQIIGIRTIDLLNYIDYEKQSVKEEIKRDLGWKDYGDKHFESVFTRFYQGFILPEKFGIDKRKAHLSALICAGQLSRAEAVKELGRISYPEELRRADADFVIKKLGLSKGEFEKILRLPRVSHAEYGVERESSISRKAFNSIMFPLARFFSLLRRARIKIAA